MILRNQFIGKNRFHSGPNAVLSYLHTVPLTPKEITCLELMAKFGFTHTTVSQQCDPS